MVEYESVDDCMNFIQSEAYQQIAGQHIHMLGRYQFLIDKININIPQLIQKIDF